MRVQLEFMEIIILQNINRKPEIIQETKWQRVYNKLEETGLIVKTVRGFSLREVSVVGLSDKRYAGAVGGNIKAMAWQITDLGKKVLRLSLPLHSRTHMDVGTSI